MSLAKLVESARVAAPDKEAVMTVNLFSFIDLFDRQLTTLAHILQKGASHAESINASEADMLSWRLTEDMQPLAFQIMVRVPNFTRAWPARTSLAYQSPAKSAPEPPSLADFLDEIAASKTYLANLTAAQFEGQDDVPLTSRDRHRHGAHYPALRPMADRVRRHQPLLPRLHRLRHPAGSRGPDRQDRSVRRRDVSQGLRG